MKIINNNLHGFNHEKANELLGGEVTFLGTFCIDDHYSPYCWYTAWNPDQSKGHKDFVGLIPIPEGGIMINGRNYDDFEKYLTVVATHCPSCDEVIYSSYRHHFMQCSCGKSFIDGGSVYTRSSLCSTLGKLNLLSQTFVPYGKR